MCDILAEILLFGEEYDGCSGFWRKLPNQVTIVGFLRFSYSIRAGEIKVVLALCAKQEALCPIHEIRLVRTELRVVVSQVTAVLFGKYPLKKHDSVKIRLLLIAGGICIQI